jgi:hypothetical protein
VSSYPLTIQVLGAGLLTMKQKQKDAKIAEHKADILSGKLQATKSNMLFTITNVTTNGDKTEYEISYELAGTVYKFYAACDKDNFYSYRAKGIQPTVYNNDTIGFSILGAQIIPNVLKVGDNVPGYSDLGQMYPVTENRNVRHVFYNTDEPFPLSQGSYTTFYGNVTSKVTYTTTTKFIKIYQGGTVLGEEDFTISGKTYKSFLIGTELWTKMDNNIDVKVEEKTYFNNPALSKNINKSFQKAYDKGGKRLESKINEMTGVNDKGYTVSYKEDWIVPGLGAVKTINYDSFGSINSIVTLVAIE